MVGRKRKMIAALIVVMIPVVVVLVEEAGVRHVAHRDPLAPGDDHVVDGQDSLGVDSHPSHLLIRPEEKWKIPIKTKGRDD